MEENQRESLEAQISAIIARYRKMTFSVAKEHMFQAYKEIMDEISRRGLHELSHKGVNGISSQNLRRMYKRYHNGEDIRNEDETTQREMLLEYLKARSLTFECIRLKYPNYLKPWKQEDDEELEIMWCRGATTEELSRHFQRNPGAIEMRIAKLQLEEKYGG